MAKFTPDLKYLSVKDEGSTYDLTVEDSAGQVTTNKLHKYFKGESPDVSQEARYSIFHRDFDFKQSRTLVVRLAGGIGDVVIGLEAVLALKERIRLESGAEFVWVAAFAAPTAIRFFSRFLAAFPIFDWIYEAESAQPIRFPFKALSGTSIDPVNEARLSIGSVWDVLFAKWGVPGKYKPAVAELPSSLVQAMDIEFKRLQASRRFPAGYKYVVLSPESRFMGNMKAWPAESWEIVERRILDETPCDILFLGKRDRLKLPRHTDRLFVHDYSVEPEPNDFLTLLSIVSKAAVVVSTDSAPALTAGFLKRPCIALFGPTSPMFWGHCNNTSLRISVCPPCSGQVFSKLCTSNICMQEIPPEDVFMLVRKFLETRVSNAVSK